MALTIQYRNNSSVHFGTENSRMSSPTKFSFEQVFSHADFSCNREEEAFQYFQCLLSDNDAEFFETHLRMCSLCARLLVDLKEAIDVGELTAIDERKADEIFQENLLKLKKILE